MSDIPDGNPTTEGYEQTTQNDPVPVVSDNQAIESGVTAPTEFEGGENSDEQLQKDDAEAIDHDNIISERTRGAKPAGGYREPGDEEVSVLRQNALFDRDSRVDDANMLMLMFQGLPSQDGTSSTDVVS